MKKILESEIQPRSSRGLSLRSVLLLVLLVGVGAGATAYAISTALAATASSSGTTQLEYKHHHDNRRAQLHLGFTGVNNRLVSKLMPFLQTPHFFPSDVAAWHRDLLRRQEVKDPRVERI